MVIKPHQKFEVIPIEGIRSLPSEKGTYLFHDVVFDKIMEFSYPPESKDVWEFITNDCDWYLQPLNE